MHSLSVHVQENMEKCILIILMLNDFWITFIESHYCCVCRKASKFMCFFCPTAVCGKCYYDVDFALVKRNRGFCRHCSKLAFLIEKNADVDSDGVSFFFNHALYYAQQKKETKNCNIMWSLNSKTLIFAYFMYIYNFILYAQIVNVCGKSFQLKLYRIVVLEL